MIRFNEKLLQQITLLQNRNLLHLSITVIRIIILIAIERYINWNIIV